MTVNTLGSDEPAAKPRNAAWLWPLLPVAVSMFALAALVSYQLHANGGQLAQSVLQRAVVAIYSFFGFVPAFFFFLLVLSWSSIWFVTGRLEKPGARLLRLFALTLALAIWVNLQPEGSEASPAAGALGNWIGARMVSTLGRFLSVLVVAPLALAALLLATDFFFYRFFEGVHARLDHLGPEPGEGVEPDVSEHFKGLSQVLSPQPARETAPPRPAAAAGGAAVAGPRAAGRAVGDRAAVLPAGIPAPIPAPVPANAPPTLDPAPVGRRESHYERRQREERERAPAGPAGPALTGPAFTGPAFTGPEIGEPEPVAFETGEPVPASGPVAAASPAADDEFSIAAAFTDPGLTDPALSDPALTDRALTDRAAADEPSESESERAAGAGSGAAGGGVARPWGAAVVDDADGDDGDEDDVDETAATGPDEDAEAAAAIHGLDGEAIVVLEPNADLVSAGFVTPMGSDAAPKADDLQRESAAAAPADDAEEPAIGSRIEPVEGRGDEAADAAPPIDERVDAGGDDAADAEPVVAIPRPAEGVRQQRLFVTTVDEGLVREAVELVTSTRRASVALLQRKLQIDFEQAMEVLAVLARRGVIDLAAGETQGRVR